MIWEGQNEANDLMCGVTTVDMSLDEMAGCSKYAGSAVTAFIIIKQRDRPITSLSSWGVLSNEDQDHAMQLPKHLNKSTAVKARYGQG